MILDSEMNENTLSWSIVEMEGVFTSTQLQPPRSLLSITQASIEMASMLGSASVNCDISEADADIRNGRVQRFDSIDALIADLESPLGDE